MTFIRCSSRAIC